MLDRETLRDRFEGCLLGGAAGDALGYSIEFWGEGQIFSRFGSEGIQTLAQSAEVTHSPVAHFSDDTQMTLFTGAGLAYGLDLGRTPDSADIWLAYREWLATQGDPSRIEDPRHPRIWLTSIDALNAHRAPGNTCLDAIRTSKGGTLEHAINNSKGCGGVMRVAPIGLLAAVRSDVDALLLGAEAAALTHSHPLGWLPAALLTGIVEWLVRDERNASQVGAYEMLLDAIDATLDEAEKRFSDVRDMAYMSELMVDAKALAAKARKGQAKDLNCVHQLGEGWVGEEALAIAVYASLAYVEDIAAALRCAVNHKGDSDSTGAIAGNILGALYGRAAVEHALDLDWLERCDIIVKVADDLLPGERGAKQPTPEKDSDHVLDAGGDQKVPFFHNPPQVEGHEAVSQLPSDVGMPYTELTKQALDLSFAVHQHQRDKSGRPYVYHPFHLAEQMRTEEAACVALLHDTLEDGDLTADDLRRYGFTESIVHAVKALTRDPLVPYMDYVLSIRNEPLAREVKLADLRHNANLARLDEVRPHDLRRYVRYLMAQALLDDAADTFDATLEPPAWRKRIPLDADRLYFLSIFYDEDGRWLRFSLDVEAASDEHFVFDACQAEPLRKALDRTKSLYEGMADAVARGGSVEVIRLALGQGIPFKSFSY